MKKSAINFSDFDDAEVIDSSPLSEKTDRVPVDVLPSNLPVVGNTGVSRRPAVFTGGSSLPLIPIIDGVFDTIKEIGRCIATVAMAKEQTRQVQAQARTQITESKEQTRRVSIQQTEETKRVAMQCRNELAQKELELKKLQKELDVNLVQSQLSHEEYMAKLDTIKRTLDPLISQSEEYIAHFSTDMNSETRKDFLSAMDKLNCHFVELAQTISQLKQG